MNRAVDLYKLFTGGGNAASGLCVVTVDNTSPLTFKFEGNDKAVDADIFTIPAGFLPMSSGDQFFTLPVLDSTQGQRWGLLVRLNR